jgi:hypothetical protein
LVFLQPSSWVGLRPSLFILGTAATYFSKAQS